MSKGYSSLSPSQMVDFPIPLAKNVCLSTGCNGAGFEDEDSLAGYDTARGSLISIRSKGDPDTMQNLANRGNRHND